jgi:hypothetical protein
VTPERAEILALEALGWLAASPDNLQRFLNQSGIDVAELREAAGTPGTALAIVEFLMTDEPLLVRFCEALEIDPRRIQAARYALGGDRA